jgi:hypothetical protein
VACGLNGLVAVDVDTDDSDVLRALRKVLGEPPAPRRGQKGFACFYRVKDGIALSRHFRGLVDVLGDGRCCIIPPTRHPSGVLYEWMTPSTLFNVPLHRLPVVGER